MVIHYHPISSLISITPQAVIDRLQKKIDDIDEANRVTINKKVGRAIKREEERNIFSQYKVEMLDGTHHWIGVTNLRFTDKTKDIGTYNRRYILGHLPSGLATIPNKDITTKIISDLQKCEAVLLWNKNAPLILDYEDTIEDSTHFSFTILDSNGPQRVTRKTLFKEQGTTLWKLRKLYPETFTEKAEDNIIFHLINPVVRKTYGRHSFLFWNEKHKEFEHYTHWGFNTRSLLHQALKLRACTLAAQGLITNGLQCNDEEDRLAAVASTIPVRVHKVF